MRLDHLLSKELLFNRWPAFVRSGSNQFPVGALVGFSRKNSRVVGFVLLSISIDELCLLFRFEGAGSTRIRPSRPARALLRCHGVSGERHHFDGARSRRRRCPLRTAEQARASLFFQATKSQRWMPWRQEPMKDVYDCEKLRGAVYRASIRRCPNGETRHSSWSVTPV